MTAEHGPLDGTPDRRARREQARRERHLLRIDVGIGAVVAVVLLLIAPGLAIVGLVAAGVLLLVAVSYGVGRVRARRGARTAPPHRRE